jgi:hypothetical protein
MRIIRTRNWLIKRIALGLALAAFATPAAQARIDEGPSAPAGSQVSLSPGPHGLPFATPSVGYRSFATDFPSSPGVSVNSGPRWTSSDLIFHPAQPQSANPELASRFGRPNATTGTELEAVNWQDVGIGAGLALGLFLVGGAVVVATRQAGRMQTA